jgi:hypothetical protein
MYSCCVNLWTPYNLQFLGYYARYSIYITHEYGLYWSFGDGIALRSFEKDTSIINLIDISDNR